MMEMLDSFGQMLTNAEHFYLFVAVVGTAIFTIQFIMSLLGLHNAENIEMEFGNADLDPGASMAEDIGNLNFFSLKSIIAFVTFFGWGGVLWGDQGWSGLALAFLSGFLMMFITSLLIFLMLKLQQSGNIDNKAFLGCNGVVYLTIPGGKHVTGQVTVTMPNCTRKIKAVAEEDLPTGTPVKVTDIVGGDCFVVTRI